MPLFVKLCFSIHLFRNSSCIWGPRKPSAKWKYLKPFTLKHKKSLIFAQNLKKKKTTPHHYQLEESARLNRTGAPGVSQQETCAATTCREVRRGTPSTPASTVTNSNCVHPSLLFILLLQLWTASLSKELVRVFSVALKNSVDHHLQMRSYWSRTLYKGSKIHIFMHLPFPCGSLKMRATEKRSSYIIYGYFKQKPPLVSFFFKGQKT